MGELAAPRSAGLKGEARGTARWSAQAALFIRWALNGKGAPARAPFWKFIARTSEVPRREGGGRRARAARPGALDPPPAVRATFERLQGALEKGD